MEGLGDLLGLGASVASGGLFGLISSGLGAFFKASQAKAERTFKLLEMEAERQIYKLQLEDADANREHQQYLARSDISAAGMDSSYSHEVSLSTGTHKWVKDLKALFRPFITLTLWLMVGWIFHTMLKGEGALDAVYTGTELVEILQYIIYSTVFAATTATTWWFGDRALAPPKMKHN